MPKPWRRSPAATRGASRSFKPPIFSLKEARSWGFLAPILLWSPKLRIPAAAYLALWGFLTVFARIASYWTPAEDYYGMHPWIAETIVRLPHGLVPLALMLLFITMKDSRVRKPVSSC